jgi:thiol:disulfide interchange protein
LAQYQETLALAKNNKQHIFLLFYMTGCDGCNIIRYLIDTNTQVQNYLKKYIVLTCDVSNTKTNLVQKYNLYSYPAYFIIDSNEKIIKQKIGLSVDGGPERNFISWLQSK